MTERLFAVVTLADVAGKLNESGLRVVAASRHSIDGTQIIMDYNHHPAVIGSLFLDGADVADVVAGCVHLSHQQALELMQSEAWKPVEFIPEGL